MSSESTDVIEQARTLRSRARDVVDAMRAERADIAEKMRAMAQRAAMLDVEIRLAQSMVAAPPQIRRPRRGSASDKVCSVLRDHPDGLVRAAIVAALARLPGRRFARTSVYSALSTLVQRRIVTSEGVAGKPHRYRLTDRPTPPSDPYVGPRLVKES